MTAIGHENWWQMLDHIFGAFHLHLGEVRGGESSLLFLLFHSFAGGGLPGIL